MKLLRMAGLLAAAFLTGCGGTGPDVMNVLNGTKSVVTAGRAAAQSDPESPYVLVETDRAMARLLNVLEAKYDTEGFFAKGGPNPIVIGRGDVVSVSIVSTSDTGFVDFTSASIAPISQTALAPQEVGADGMIRVPPLGRVKVAGRSTAQVESLLTRRLSEVLVEPSAIVTIADRRSAKVAVVGKVGAPGKYSISDTDLRLLDMITMAGGPTQRSENLRIRLSRNGRTRETSLNAVLQHDNLNVFVQPGDVVELETPEDRIVILGAGASNNSTILLDFPDSSLADVLGLGGGLAGRTANRKGVFIYRETRRETLATLQADLSGFWDDEVPTIFRIDMTEPDSLFVAQNFRVRDGDILYIAPSVSDAIRAFTTYAPAPSAYVGASALGPERLVGN